MPRVREIACAAFAVLGCGSTAGVPEGDGAGEVSSTGVDEPAEWTPVCGNGRREEGEACDLGIGNEVGAACTALCTLPVCGDGVLAPGEECDDGNTESDDGCSPSCLVEGRPLWSVTVDGDERDEAFYDLAVVDDRIVAVGNLNRSFYDSVPLIVSLSADRVVQWRTTIESAYGGGVARRVLATRGDAVVAGTIVDDELGPAPWLARFDAEGRLLQSRVLAIPQARGVTGMVAAGPDRAIVIGELAYGGPGVPRQGWVAEVDLLDATVVWHTALESEHELWGIHDVAAVGDGWVLSGRLQASEWVGRYDASWTLEWERVWEQSTWYTASLAVAGDAEGRVYLAGASPIPEPEATNDTQRWIVALESDGSVAWEVTEPVLPGGYDAASDIASDGSGGVWVSGSVKQQPLMVSASTDVDAWVQRYDRHGTPTDGYTFDGQLHGYDRALGLVVTGPDAVMVAGSSTVLFERHNPWIASFGPGDRPVMSRSPSPPPVERSAHPRLQTPHRASLFIDFAGRELRPGNWGTHGEIPCLGEPIEFPGYMGSRADAEAIVERVEDLLTPYGIAVHWKRRPPAALPYTTVVVGGLSEQLGLDERVKGFACMTDCGDAWPRDLAFAFDGGPRSVAMNIVHEAAHTWGLDHESGGFTVMQPFVGPGTTWSTECVPVSDATSDSHCAATNLAFCPAGEQNSDAVLTALFGTDGIDDVPPVVEIRSPASNSVHPLGEPIILEVDVTDDRGNPGFRVAVDALDWSRIAVGTESRFELALPAGTFEIRIEAVDHGGNEARRSVLVEVVP